MDEGDSIILYFENQMRLVLQVLYPNELGHDFPTPDCQPKIRFPIYITGADILSLIFGKSSQKNYPIEDEFFVKL